MAEGVVTPCADERESWLYGSNEFGRCRVCRAVVPRLQDVWALDVCMQIHAARSETPLGLETRITRK